MSVAPELSNESLIVCENSQGSNIRATLLRMTRYVVSFEVYNPYSILQLSEVLNIFKIVINNNTIYSGRAIITGIVNTGLLLVCEASLDEESWLDVDLLSPVTQLERLASDFERLIDDWAKIEKVSPEMKIVISDMQALLRDMRRWLEQVEHSLRTVTSPERQKLELSIIEKLNKLVLPITNEIFQKFEDIAGAIQEEVKAVHRAYARRQLHPFLLASPFIYRTFQKPLGYAGDYEMVNMILRDPTEGASLFAKVINTRFVNGAPAEAHRNRIKYLSQALRTETRKRAKLGQLTHIFNLGCGPAKEIQDFLTFDDLCDRATFTLLDFNEETLAYTGKLLNELKMKHQRQTPITMIQRSVHQILKEGRRGTEIGRNSLYDIVYCAGLFDYLSDRICLRLMDIFYEIVAPGGLLIATNVEASNPDRQMMEYIMDWHLIYRDSKQLLALSPQKAPRENCRVLCDETKVNLFLEVRKPLGDG
ncbi:MAG: class I SAM-dependent methyltransferase [Methylacidiphilales bacterium]|nr:class I SAM-dependent methyltransferase [Candidatus Methylacidiphilales bacterium]